MAGFWEKLNDTVNPFAKGNVVDNTLRGIDKKVIQPAAKEATKLLGLGKKKSGPTLETQIDKEISAFQDMLAQYEQQFGQMEAYNRNIDARNQMRFLSEYIGRSASADLGIGSTKRRQGNPMQSASSVERALFGV